uniref:Uncharacterized protein n=1 Tax=Caenorhabditis japonica TaxID=281687 RepID=A0A8R1I761_CAEJA
MNTVALPLLLLLLAVCTVNGFFNPLSSYTSEETLYRINKTSKIYVISNSPQELLQSLTVSTASGQNSTGFTLSTVQTDGSLTPFQSANDNDFLTIAYNGASPLSGWLYINRETENLNVFPITENKSINFKQGTNTFIRMDSPAGMIPVAENVLVGSNAALVGFTGLPDDVKKVQFFNSSSISGVSKYDQLELPVQMFHFTSTGNDIKYEVKFSQRIHMPTVGSAGLLMSDDFPTKIIPAQDYKINNPNNVTIALTLVPRFDKNTQTDGNITIFYADENLRALNFPFSSDADTLITSTGPMNRIVADTNGSIAIQYYLKDATVTTPAPVQTTTKSASFPQLIASLLVAAVLRF